MKKLAFGLILFLAMFLRLFMLGSLPSGFSWDEAAIGYNGYGIMTVHRDEWLVKMPVTFKSFGDYKAAFAIYTNAISTKILGRNVFAVRFPMAVFGVITVVAVYFIAKKIFDSEDLALLSMFLLAVSPLNVHYSRIAFESGIAVALCTLAVMFFLYAQKRGYLYILSSLLFVSSLYAYHSTKIAVPILVILLAIKERKIWMKHVGYVVVAVFVGIACMYPLMRETLYGNAGERFYMTSAIADRNGLKPVPFVVGIVATNYVKHMLPNFLLFGETQNYRHGNGVFGILGYTEFILLLAGLISMCKKEWRKKYGWLIVLVLIGILPAAISNEAPHSNRAHGIVPWIQLISVVGFSFISTYFTKERMRVFTRIVILLTLVQTVYFAFLYKNIYSSIAVRDFQYGYQEAIQYARLQESSVHSVLLTSKYGQPYIYILFYKGLTSIEWQQGALANYELRDFTWDEVKERKDILIIGSPQEIPQDAQNIVKEIRFPDGEIAFRIVKQ